MRQTLALILPVLIPSWRFFRAIEPSPRVQWAKVAQGVPQDWQEFRPRPARVTPWQMLGRLFYNARWNEALYLVACAERIAVKPTEHSVTEIQRRLSATLAPALPGTEVQFRLIFVHRQGDEIVQEVLYRSAPFHLSSEGRA